MSALDRYVTAAYRATLGYSVDPASVDYLTFLRANPDAVTEARDEVAALSNPRAGLRVFSRENQGAHEQKVRYDMLTKMLAAFDAAEGSN